MPDLPTNWLIGLDAATLFARGVHYATFRDLPKDVKAIKAAFGDLQAKVSALGAWKEEVDHDREDHELRLRTLEQG